MTDTDPTPQRHRNDGVRKVCTCARRNWPKCPHSWYVNYKPRHGQAYRFSIDAEAGTHVETKEDAKAAAEAIKVEIRAGTFMRAADRRKAEAEAAAKAAAEAAAKPSATAG